MQIKRIHVVNYRSIIDETLDCSNLTVLIGKNGSGKSSFLQALKLYMETGASPSIEDFYNRESNRQIQIEVTFTGLTDDEKDEFRSYLDGDLLTVQRRFPSGDYYGRAYGCPELEPLREQIRQKVKVGDIAKKLKEFVDSGNFPGLKVVAKNIEEELNSWESENKNRCRSYFRAGLFQGPMNIAGGKLKSKTHFVYIPPVREAETDASGGGKATPLGTLIAPLLNAITEQNVEIKNVKQGVAEGVDKYKLLLANAPEKESLGQSLTDVLKRYDQGASATVRLIVDGEMKLPDPKPKIWLSEDGFEGDVSRKGHGLQRLFTFSILELYEVFRNRREVGGEGETIVLAIEEPELYQYPARARALARTLRRLSDGSSTQNFHFQIFYSTHSPYFVSLGSFANLRRAEKVAVASGPMESKIRFTTLKDVGQKVLTSLKIQGDPTDSSSWARLRSILGVKASEGFFSEGIVLVEGAEDEAILHAFLSQKDKILDQYGISLIPAEGKTNLPWLLSLYQQLGIPVYTIFDGDDGKSDENAKRNFNEALLELMGEPRNARPDTKVMSDGCVWKDTFADEIKKIFGTDSWEVAFQAACKAYDIPADQGRKKYAIILKTMETLLQKGGSYPIVEQLLSAIFAKFGIS